MRISRAKVCRILVASVARRGTRRGVRVIRATRVPSAAAFRRPTIKSPSQGPGTVRSAPSAGRASRRSLAGMGPRRSGLPRRPRRGFRRCRSAWSRARLSAPRGRTYQDVSSVSCETRIVGASGDSAFSRLAICSGDQHGVRGAGPSAWRGGGVRSGRGR